MLIVGYAINLATLFVFLLFHFLKFCFAKYEELRTMPLTGTLFEFLQ